METDEKKISLAAAKEMFVNAGRILKLIWQDRKELILTIGLVFLIVAAGPFIQSGTTALLINELIASAASGEFTSFLLWIVVLIISANVIISFAMSANRYLDRKFWFFIQEKFELMMLKKRGEIDVSVYEDPEKNNLFQKVNEGGVWRVHNFTDRELYLFQNIFEVGLASIVLISAQWWIFLIIFLSLIPDLILEARYGQGVWGIFHARAEVRRRFWDLRRHFEWLPNLIELKVFQNLGFFWSSVKDLMTGFHREELKHEKKRFLRELAASFLGQAAIAFATVWFILEAIGGQIQIGTLTFFLASIVGLRRSLGGFFLNLGRQYQDSLFVTDVFKVLDLPEAVIKPKQGIKLNLNSTPEIIFENITFSYPGTKKQVLKNFSLKILPGEKIALVGLNGAGKTTLIKLLARFYDPTKGKIFVNGHDLKRIDLNSWYAMLGILFQDYANYHFIVKEAISVGRTGDKPSWEKVKQSARASEAEKFIKEWDKAYHQMLGKEFTGGVEPSIGQWQKLALARTFYRDPRILILDEPTSSIDAEAEAKIFDKLENLPKDRTVILISHRFSTVRHANRICVIEDGRLKELGTHEELLKLGGTYARLFRLQAKGYK